MNACGRSVSEIHKTTTWNPIEETVQHCELFQTVYFDDAGKMTLVVAGVGESYVEAMSGPVRIFDKSNGWEGL